MGAYHIFGGTQTNRFFMLDQSTKNGTHPFGIVAKQPLVLEIVAIVSIVNDKWIISNIFYFEKYQNSYAELLFNLFDESQRLKIRSVAGERWVE